MNLSDVTLVTFMNGPFFPLLDISLSWIFKSHMTWMSNVDNNPRIVQTPHAWMKCQRGISLPIGVLRCNFLKGQGDLSKSVFFSLQPMIIFPTHCLFTVFFKSNHIHNIYIISFTFSLALKWAIEKNPVFLNTDSMLLMKLAFDCCEL